MNWWHVENKELYEGILLQVDVSVAYSIRFTAVWDSDVDDSTMSVVEIDGLGEQNDYWTFQKIIFIAWVDDGVFV